MDREDDRKRGSIMENPQAFPNQEMNQGMANEQIDRGMLLRDWFAGLSLQLHFEKWMKDGPEIVARESYAIADAMLKERSK